VAVRFASSSRVKNDLPRYSNFWDGTTVFTPFTVAGSYDALAVYTVGSGGISNIEFTGIPTGGQYTHLQIRGIVRSNRSAVEDQIRMQFNTDTGSNYAWHWLIGDGSSASAQNGTSTASPWAIESAGNTATASAYGAFVVDILDYASISKNKTVRGLSGYDGNGNGTVILGSNLWLNTSAINSIKLSPIFGSSINQYSQFALYGIRG
jgi:hypothetical protein